MHIIWNNTSGVQDELRNYTVLTLLDPKLKWPLPALIFDMSTVAKGASVKTKTRLANSVAFDKTELRIVSSDSSQFANVQYLVCRAERL